MADNTYAAYIVEVDYTTLYTGASIPSGDFSRMALRASDAIDKMTLRRIRTAGLDTLSAETQELVKLATCAMAEGLYQVDQATGGTGVVVSSEKVGSYSYSLAQDAVNQTLMDAAERAMDYLMFTGLMYRGVTQCGQ